MGACCHHAGDRREGILARSTAATTAVVVAVGLVAASWLVTRALGVSDPLDPVLAVVLSPPERLALLLALAALVVFARRRARRLGRPANRRCFRRFAVPTPPV